MHNRFNTYQNCIVVIVQVITLASTQPGLSESIRAQFVKTLGLDKYESTQRGTVGKECCGHEVCESCLLPPSQYCDSICCRYLTRGS